MPRKPKPHSTHSKKRRQPTHVRATARGGTHHPVVVHDERHKEPDLDLLVQALILIGEERARKQQAEK